MATPSTPYSSSLANTTSEDEINRLIEQSKPFATQHLSIMTRFGLEPGMRVLDVGCGPGSVTIFLADQIRPGSVVGLDENEGLLQGAKDYAEKVGIDNVEFVAGDVTREDCTTSLYDSFDFVYCRFVLWSIKERGAALANMIRFARPGGLVLAIEPDLGNLIAWPPNDAKQRYWDALIRYEREAGTGTDRVYGRKLFADFHRSGLE
jgi:ubiquinone/menaquinone biosynthesis C-methylase UbiE